MKLATLLELMLAMLLVVLVVILLEMMLEMMLETLLEMLLEMLGLGSAHTFLGSTGTALHQQRRAIRNRSRIGKRLSQCS